MKKIITLLALLLACLVPSLVASEEKLCLNRFIKFDPGNPNHPDFVAERDDLRAWPKYESVLLLYLLEYDRADDRLRGEYMKSAGEMPKEELRKAIMERIKTHPEELNDMAYTEGWSVSPLSMLISSGELDLIQLALEHGAIPYCEGMREFNYPNALDKETQIKALLERACAEWPRLGGEELERRLKADGIPASLPEEHLQSYANRYQFKYIKGTQEYRARFPKK